MCCGTRWPDASAAARATAKSGATRVVSSRCFSVSIRACGEHRRLLFCWSEVWQAAQIPGVQRRVTSGRRYQAVFESLPNFSHSPFEQHLPHKRMVDPYAYPQGQAPVVEDA